MAFLTGIDRVSGKCRAFNLVFTPKLGQTGMPNLEGGTGNFQRVFIGFSNRDLAADPDRGSTWERPFGSERHAAFCVCLAISRDALFRCIDPTQSTLVKTVLSGVSTTSGVGGRVPNGRMRILKRAQFHRHFVIIEMPALVAESVRRHAFQ